jgi:hypothetical protein
MYLNSILMRGLWWQQGTWQGERTGWSLDGHAGHIPPGLLVVLVLLRIAGSSFKYLGITAPPSPPRPFHLVFMI